MNYKIVIFNSGRLVFMGWMKEAMPYSVFVKTENRKVATGDANVNTSTFVSIMDHHGNSL